jgi:hypothetical protein
MGKGEGFRLRLHPLRRVLLSVVLMACIALFVPAIVGSGVDGWFRLLSVAGTAAAVIGLRILLGPVVRVRREGLRIEQRWPLRRDIPWYRLLEIEVVPGAWVLVAELNSGERFTLPCVEDVDRLYEAIEANRSRLDAAP